VDAMSGDWIDRILAPLAPGIAARRIRAKASLAAAERLYQAVQASDYRPRRGSGASGDAVMDQAKGRMREFGRYLDENSDITVGLLDDLVTNTVGTGVGIEPMARLRDGTTADALNLELSALWREFWACPESTGEIPGCELERLAARSWLRDGEVFLQHLPRPSPAGEIPYCLMPLESDFVPFDLTDRVATHGVIKDRFGRPAAYHVYQQHPGEMAASLLNLGLTPETVIVSAENMTHLKFVRRFHQTRGVSVLHSVLTRLDDLKDYEESERVAARIAAAFSAYIKRSGEWDSDIDPDTLDRKFSMAPGAIFDKLLPGEDVGTIDAKRPNNEVGTYIGIQERRIAAGTGTRYSSVSRNYNGTYSAQRQELVEGRTHYLRLFSYLVARFYLPVWRRFVDSARLAGRIRLSSDLDLVSVYRPEIRPPSLPWIDPRKEIEAHGLAVQYGFRSRWQVIRDLGGDPRTVDQQLAADDFDFRPDISAQQGPAGAQQPNVDDEDEEKAA
jgi:lambda family phage portal protein